MTLYDLPFSQLEAERNGLRTAHARLLWKALYLELEKSPAERKDFPPALREWLAGFSEPHIPLAVPAGDGILSADGLAGRFLLSLGDGSSIETVLMKFAGRSTACLSTQVGCAMGCVFCATGQQGFTRHLTAGEIVAQAVHCQRLLAAGGGAKLRNLVLMGMGEPLHNYDNTMTALEVLSDTGGLNIGPSRITVSTVGVVPGIERWTRERRPYNLAVSLHSADADERASLVPAARRWPLDALMAACRDYCSALRRRIFFEWTLIRGVNDSPAHARQVTGLLRGMPAHVNLIPLNPTGGYAGLAAGIQTARLFQAVLKESGVPSTVRQRRGIDVEAGCGQLRADADARSA